MSVQTTKAIKSIRFSVWSPTEIRKYSVAEITVPETYDEDGIPVQGGLMDGRLGTLEPGQKCLTCGNMAARCPGHFGHLELAEPILHIAFIDNIHKLLLISCRSCSRLKVTQTDLEEFSNIQKREAAYTVLSQKHIPEKILEIARKAKECPHCGKAQYELIFTKPTIFIEKTEVGENRLLPITIRERFSQIPDSDLKLLGLIHRLQVQSGLQLQAFRFHQLHRAAMYHIVTGNLILALSFQVVHPLDLPVLVFHPHHTFLGQ